MTSDVLNKLSLFEQPLVFGVRFDSGLSSKGGGGCHFPVGACSQYKVGGVLCGQTSLYTGIHGN